MVSVILLYDVPGKSVDIPIVGQSRNKNLKTIKTMKKNSYIILALAGMLSMNSCNDDEFLPGNPSMEIKAENADALFW